MKGKLDAYLDPQEGDMLRLLERIVNMDSFTTDARMWTNWGPS